jgi:phytoene/squalene synthetase
MSQEVNFYQQHLEKVSRSFAYCIQQMDSPLREWTSLTYLLCRVLDTVEDSAWPSKQVQLQKIKDFLPLFKTKGISDTQALSEVQSWARGFSREITQAERALIQDLPKLIGDFKKYPPEVQSAIASLISSMSSGMGHFLARADQATQHKIQTLAELNEYCFFVAGVVGEAMTHFVAYKGGYNQDHAFTNSENLVRSFHFGLFLQKVNILKDQFKDEKEGRFFIFDRAKVLESLSDHAEQTLAYIKSIPVQEKGYRVFCATSFFLGLATVPLLQIQDSGWIEPKLEREEALELFKQIEMIAASNEEMDILFNRYKESLVAKATYLQKFSGEDWFFESYQGSLDRSEIQL